MKGRRGCGARPAERRVGKKVKRRGRAGNVRVCCRWSLLQGCPLACRKTALDLAATDRIVRIGISHDRKSKCYVSARVGDSFAERLVSCAVNLVRVTAAGEMFGRTFHFEDNDNQFRIRYIAHESPAESASSHGFESLSIVDTLTVKRETLRPAPPSRVEPRTSATSPAVAQHRSWLPNRKKMKQLTL